MSSCWLPFVCLLRCATLVCVFVKITCIHTCTYLRSLCQVLRRALRHWTVAGKRHLLSSALCLTYSRLTASCMRRCQAGGPTDGEGARFSTFQKTTSQHQLCIEQAVWPFKCACPDSILAIGNQCNWLCSTNGCLCEAAAKIALCAANTKSVG